MSGILITGGTGFVGKHLTQFLKPHISDLAILASGGSSTAEPDVDYFEVDIRDRDCGSVGRTEVEPNRIYHLAGVSAVDVPGPIRN